MPLVPSLAERLVLLRANQGPGPILDLFGAVGLKTVLAAGKAGVLDELSRGAASTPLIAERLSLDPRAVGVLLGVLEPLGYVRRRGDEYELTPMSRKWLVTDADVPFIDFLRWWDDAVLPYWDDHLEEALTSGRPSLGLYDSLDDDGWAVAQAGFEAVARLAAPHVARRVPLPSDKGRLLDLGGGHGIYSLEICRRFPGWSATVVDNDSALKTARRNIESWSLQDRVTVRIGDALVGDLGDGYDAFLLFNVIHGFDQSDNRLVLSRVHDALAPGGVIVILEQFDDRVPGRVGRFGPRLLDFAYFVGLGGRVYSVDEVSAWLTGVGFIDPKRRRLIRVPGNSMLSATRV